MRTYIRKINTIKMRKVYAILSNEIIIASFNLIQISIARNLPEKSRSSRFMEFGLLKHELILKHNKVQEKPQFPYKRQFTLPRLIYLLTWFMKISYLKV